MTREEVQKLEEFFANADKQATPIYTTQLKSLF